MQYFKRRPGLDIFVDRDLVHKLAKNDEARKEIQNEARMLALLADTEICPKLILQTEDELVQELIPVLSVSQNKYLGFPCFEDSERLNRNAKQFIEILSERGIRHGDLGLPNLFVLPGDKLLAVDWHQSNLFSEAESEKRKGVSDEEMLKVSLISMGVT